MRAGKSRNEAAHCFDVGACDATDTARMAYDGLHGYVVLTQDLDFGAILAATRCAKPSVVQLRATDARSDTIGYQVVAALWETAPRSREGALRTFHVNNIRNSVVPDFSIRERLVQACALRASR